MRPSDNSDILNMLAFTLGNDVWVKENLNLAAQFPELAADIEAILSAAADEGGFDKANLPVYLLQSDENVSHPVYIGKTTWDGRTFKDYVLPLESFFLHVLVSGGSGSGKSNLVKNCVSQMAGYSDRINFWILDLLKEYREVAKGLQNVMVLPLSSLKLNPLRPPVGVETTEWAQVFTEIYSHSFRVLTASKSLVHTKLHDLYKMCSDGEAGTYPSLPDFLEFLRGQKLDRTNWAYLPLNVLRLESICRSLAGIIDVSKGILDELADENVIFELDGTGESELQNFLCEYLMSHAFYSRRNTTSTTKQLILIADEGHRIYDRSKEHTAAGLPLIDTLVTQARHSKISVVCSVQEISKATSTIAANSRMKIILRQGSGRDEDEISKALQLSKEQKDFLPQLKVGEAIIATETGLSLVKVKPFSQTETASEAEVGERTKTAVEQLLRVVEERSDWLRTKLVRVNGHGSDFEKDLLLCLTRNPLFTSGQLAETMGVTRAKADRALDSLELKGLLRKVKPLNLYRGGARTLFEPTSKGRVVIQGWGHRYYHPGKCGLESFFYLSNFIEPYFRERGFLTKIEGRSGSSTTDMLATRNGSTISIELHLGEANIDNNIQRNLRATGIDKTILILRDENLKHKVAASLNELIEANRERIEVKVVSDFAPNRASIPAKEIENENET